MTDTPVATPVAEFMPTLFARHGNNPTRILQILRDVQASYAYIPEEAVSLLAKSLGISRTQILSVIEFYSFLHLTPRGQYDILLSDSITDNMLGSRELANYLCDRLKIKISQVRSDGLVSVDYTSCTGLCDQGPAGLVNGYALSQLTRARIDRIAALIEKRIPVNAWPADLFTVNDNIKKADLLLAETIHAGSALNSVFGRGREQIFAELEKSGLRGRGGAGFTTAWKWRFCHEGPEDFAICPTGKRHELERYVVCNADEGEPGTFKDRVLLQTYAHQVFEGMTVCAALIGAQQGFLYLRGEYSYLYESLQAILAERRKSGLLGKNILGQLFDFDIDIHLGAGAYICGEESALIESLEGKPGKPRNRPPYPVTSGYLGKPTVVNNVETFAAAAKIAVEGGDWFAAVGTAKSKGTKILSISGDCDHPGLYEYPFGTPIKTILEDCGAKDVFGLQIGGPSGMFISNRELDRKLAFEDLATGGSFIVFNNQRDLLEIVRNFTHFFAHESCGFCTPCRVGTSLLRSQLDKICDGHGSAGDLVELAHLSKLVKSASHCGLGQTAANPILTTLERYPEVYQARLKQVSFEPGFDLDGALAIAREMSGRDDAHAHLVQVEE